MPSKVRIYPEIRTFAAGSDLAEFSSELHGNGRLWMFIFIIGMALLGSSLSSYDPFDQNANALLLPPSGEETGSLHYFLGTDDLGRDVLVALLYGAQLTFGSAFDGLHAGNVLGSSIGILRQCNVVWPPVSCIICSMCCYPFPHYYWRLCWCH